MKNERTKRVTPKRGYPETKCLDKYRIPEHTKNPKRTGKGLSIEKGYA